MGSHNHGSTVPRYFHTATAVVTYSTQAGRYQPKQKLTAMRCCNISQSAPRQLRLMNFIERRKNQRVTDILALCINSAAFSCEKASYIVKLSAQGMRFTCESEIPIDIPLDLELHLSSQSTPIKLQATAISWSQPQSDHNTSKYNTRMLFNNIDDVSDRLLKQHIDTVFSQTRVIKELPYKKYSEA